MRHPIPIALILLAVMWTPMSLVAQSKKDMKAVKQVIKQYENALNNRSLEDIVNVFAIDAVVLPPDAPALSGHGAIRERYAPLTDPDNMIDITHEIQELILLDDVAYAWSLNYGKIRIGDGEESEIDSKSLMVLQKTIEGWKAHRYMFNGNKQDE